MADGEANDSTYSLPHSSSEEEQKLGSDDEKMFDNDYSTIVKVKNNNYPARKNRQNRNTSNANKATAWNSPTGRLFMSLYNDLREFQEVYRVKISVPMFIFFGYQSSGKTSAVSQAAQMCVGVMQDGTASRCPVRFKLINNPKIAPENKIIIVKGKRVKDEITLVSKLLEHGKELETKGGFSDQILEVSIESSDVPQLTFVDLPGLLKKEDDKDREKLDRLTAKFINDINFDGSPNYIPIFVRQAIDMELDDDQEINHIDSIVRTYGSNYNRKTNWQDDALFIVNKFDRVANMSTAEGLSKLIEHSCRYGKKTVITVLNPNGYHKTSRMEHKELNAFVKRVPGLEREFWEKQYSTIIEDTENIPRLKSIVKTKCGVGKMNEIIGQTMVDIVKKTLPGIENRLEDAQRSKLNGIKKIEEQLKFCDPSKLKTKIADFSNLFLENLRKYYKGELADDLQGYTRFIKRQTWTEEMYEAKRSYCFKINKQAIGWSKKYELTSEVLSKICNECGDNELRKLLKYGLNGSKQIERQIYVWRALVALMAFPDYSDETIVNMSDAVGTVLQPDPWINARNVVLNATTHLQASCEWLAEILRYKVLQNADAIWLYTFILMFGEEGDDEPGDTSATAIQQNYLPNPQSNKNGMNEYDDSYSNKKFKKKSKKKKKKSKKDLETEQNDVNNGNNTDDVDDENRQTELKNKISHRNGMKTLLKRCLQDYKKQVTNIVDSFRNVAQIVPRDLGEVMDKQFIQTLINVGVFTKEELKEFEHKIRESKFGYNKKKKNKHKKKAKKSKKPQKNSGIIKDDGQQKNVSELNNIKRINKIVKKDEKKKKHKNKKGKKGKKNNNDIPDSSSSSSSNEAYYKNDTDNDDNKDGNKDGDVVYFTSEDDGKDKMDSFDNKCSDDYSDVSDADEVVNGVDKYFFKYVYSTWAIKHITLINQPDTIRGIAKIYWIGIKSFVIRDIIQKYTNRIMSSVRQHDSKFSNAVSSGVETRKIRKLISKLADLTQISNNSLDDFVKKHAPSAVIKDVKDFGNNEIMKAYGVDAKALSEEKNKRIEDLKKFRESKDKWMKKIARFKVTGYN